MIISPREQIKHPSYSFRKRVYEITYGLHVYCNILFLRLLSLTANNIIFAVNSLSLFLSLTHTHTLSLFRIVGQSDDALLFSAESFPLER